MKNKSPLNKSPLKKSFFKNADAEDRQNAKEKMREKQLESENNKRRKELLKGAQPLTDALKAIVSCLGERVEKKGYFEMITTDIFNIKDSKSGKLTGVTFELKVHKSFYNDDEREFLDWTIDKTWNCNYYGPTGRVDMVQSSKHWMVRENATCTSVGEFRTAPNLQEAIDYSLANFVQEESPERFDALRKRYSRRAAPEAAPGGMD